MLATDTTEAVLERLGFSEAPALDLDGLNRLYSAWGRAVPFDNLIKRIHLADGGGDPIPNDEPHGFYFAYMRYGAGGTCWPSSGGLHALLVTLGFEARLASGAMRDDRVGPIHTHGTILVTLDDVDYWVDSSMLTDRVFPVVRGETTTLDDPLHRVRVEPVDDLWRVWWTHPFLDEMVPCLLLADDVDARHYHDRYEWSRENSPFNTRLYATKNIAETRVTVAYGQRFERTANGMQSRSLTVEERDQILVDEFGYHPDLLAITPSDPPLEDRN